MERSVPKEKSMISTTTVGSGDWPEGAKQLNWRQLCQSTSSEERSRLYKYPDDPIGQIIEMWLFYKYSSRSGASTATIYRKVLDSLRAYLHMHHLDLNS